MVDIFIGEESSPLGKESLKKRIQTDKGKIINISNRGNLELEIQEENPKETHNVWFSGEQIKFLPVNYIPKIGDEVDISYHEVYILVKGTREETIYSRPLKNSRVSTLGL